MDGGMGWKSGKVNGKRKWKRRLETTPWYERGNRNEVAEVSEVSSLIYIYIHKYIHIDVGCVDVCMVLAPVSRSFSKSAGDSISYPQLSMYRAG